VNKLIDLWDWNKELALWQTKRDELINQKKEKKSLSKHYMGGGTEVARKEKFFDCDDDRNCFDIEACARTICRAFEVSVPFAITPRAVVGTPEVSCRGDVVTRPCRIRCEHEGRTFDFTVTQVINVEIPIEFAAEVCINETCARDVGECDQHRC
jgi:hypothetical protein